MSENTTHYPADMLILLETVWGEGFLSPGGPEEVARIIGNLDLRGLKILDIGCGAGGIDIDLVRTHGAGYVIGIDVEDDVLNRARILVKKHELDSRISCLKVNPGPLDFEAGSFDIVFSKDSIVHIPDKHALMADVYRILKPGGRFIASDWLISTETVSPAMAEYIKSEGLDFQMATPARYREAMTKAGFTDINIVSRNEWYRQQARKEVALLQGPASNKIAEKLGSDYLKSNISLWERMISVLDSGELCPSHLHGLKPL